MNTEDLEKKWKELNPEKTSSFKSLRFSPDCIPDLFIGIDLAAIRCLILKIPKDHIVNFQSVARQNLSIEHYKETHWIILKLTSQIYADLFNDLIISLYEKIKSIG